MLHSFVIDLDNVIVLFYRRTLFSNSMKFLFFSNVPRNITWLAREASNRYFQLFNLRPVLSLATKDGAMLSPDDQIISVFSNNEEACISYSQHSFV